MTRLFIFLLTLALTSFTAMWFIENDGSVTIRWLGYQIQTSMAFTMLASLMALVILTTLIRIFLWFRNLPKQFSDSASYKKRNLGLTALSEGFAAIAAEDIRQAQKLSKQAVGYLGDIPLTRLLQAQTAQLEGNTALARDHYRAMLEDKKTEMIAIKGLFSQAEHEGDMSRALELAEKAFALRPKDKDVILTLIHLYKMTKRWDMAETMVHRAAKLKFIPKEEAKRAYAVIALAQCQEMVEIGKTEQALVFAKRAFSTLPGFTPAALTYAGLLATSDHKRKALKILESAWKREPHPHIADAYMALHQGEPKEKLLKQAERLLSFKPSQREGHIAVAKAALLAGLPGKARSHLRIALTTGENRSTCTLMAQAEEADGASRDTVNQWRQRAETCLADPTWICTSCGRTTPHWHAHCKGCKSVDAMVWGTPGHQVTILSPGNASKNSLLSRVA